MNLTNEICRQAARYDAVAFDVFDTLIKRDTARPTGVFALRGEAFCAARTQAECEARAAKSGEVTPGRAFLAMTRHRSAPTSWQPVCRIRRFWQQKSG